MDRFVKLEVMSHLVPPTERWFNIRHIKSVQPTGNSVLVEGSKNYFTITDESMRRLLDVIGGGSPWRRFVTRVRRLLHIDGNT